MRHNGRPSPALGDPGGDEGFAGGVDGLIFGLLIFVVGTLIVASAWGVVDTKMVTGTAATEAARTYVESDDATDAAAGAQAAAEEALEGFGRNPARASVALAGGSFGRCRRITIRVTYPSPLLVLPLVGRVGRGIQVHAEHSELVDPYRAGLPGTASCT